jgi:alpha-amylase
LPSVCFYFEVHQPFRLRRVSQFELARHHHYFDDDKNRAIIEKVADKCYLPTNQALLDLVNHYSGAFRIAFSLTGTVIEQMQLYAPRVLESFQQLAATGAVEFIDETYYHSLAALYDPEEFRAQVLQHRALMKELFDIEPTIFRNTELIYDDGIGRMVHDLGYRAVIAEGCDDILDWRSPNFLYQVAGCDTRLLLKNYRLSDDIAFRFSNRGWKEFPLTADKFARWVHAISGNGEILNLFMDYETFGEHQWESTGIFNFLKHLPAAIFRHPDWNFLTPSQVVDTYKPVGELSFTRLTSWADVERDTTAWRGNKMQLTILRQVYEIGERLRREGTEEDLKTWRRLQTSDHFYYMCTKWFADGDVHAYFSPYESPYEAFVTYMNAWRDFLQTSIARNVPTVPPISRA